MSLSGLTAPPTPPFDKLAIEKMHCHDIFSAEFAIRNLGIKHNVHAVQEQLLLYPHPQLWLTFIHNKNIWPVIDQKLLDNMNRYTYKMVGSSTDANPWNLVHNTLIKSFKQICYTQTPRIHTKLILIENIEPGEWFEAIYDDLLQSDDINLWYAFINNPAIFLVLTHNHYCQLVQALLNRACLQDPLDENWVILLTLYAFKGYPVDYPSILRQLSTCYPIMVNYAVAQISLHCHYQDSMNRTETVKWLNFLIKMSAVDISILLLLRQNAILKNIAPHFIPHLGSNLLFEFLQIFPDCFAIVLDHLHNQILALNVGYFDRSLKESVSLVKALEFDPKFHDMVHADKPCQTLLNYFSLLSDKFEKKTTRRHLQQAPTLVVDAFAEPPPLSYAPLLRRKLQR